MGTADGAVVGTTKIVDHGSDADRWVLVILADGYQASELPRFRTDAQAFVDTLATTPPFDELWCSINAHRVDVRSTDSGADEPATCADGTTGAGTTARTYFDATFCTAGVGRLLVGDQTLALTTATTAVPEVDATVVIVNTSRYGGAGGTTAWFSTAPSANEIGIHELGHSAFVLADEYADLPGTYAGGEPPEPNVTTITARATTKWASRIAAATLLPTQSNPGCPLTMAASPVSAGTIGLFEGGGRRPCGLYRSEHQCKMRTLGQPFCTVCREAIKARLRPHLPPFSGPITGVQFTGTVPAGETRRWFTYSWPACWHVIWSVAPVSPVTPTTGLSHRVQVERTARELLTYHVSITNTTSSGVDVAARYAVVAST